MGNTGESIHRLCVHQNIKTNQLSTSVLYKLIVEGCISTGSTLEAIIEIEHHLCHWELIHNLNTIVLHKRLINVHPTPILAKLHDGPNIVCRCNNAGANEWFEHIINQSRFWHFAWVVYKHTLPIGTTNLVPHVWHCGDNVDVELSVQPLLDNLHVK